MARPYQLNMCSPNNYTYSTKGSFMSMPFELPLSKLVARLFLPISFSSRKQDLLDREGSLVYYSKHKCSIDALLRRNFLHSP